jgi:hyperosmotically inducible periplasmic protein
MKRIASILTISFASALMLAATGCAVTRDQQTVGAYIDDASITTTVKGKFIEDKAVAASSISVETLNGTVQLAGFAKSSVERNQAEAIARNVKGVKSVRNDIVIRP